MNDKYKLLYNKNLINLINKFNKNNFFNIILLT